MKKQENMEKVGEVSAIVLILIRKQKLCQI